MTFSDSFVVPTVIIIDDDNDVRDALGGLFVSVGLKVEAYPSVQAYLDAGPNDRLGCMILDVRLPGKNGLDFQADLVGSNQLRPIIFISGHADVAMSVRAMKAGAVEFFAKPVHHQSLLDAVQVAIDKDRARRALDQSLVQLREDFASLTQREREILGLVVLGLRNKQIAAEAGVTEATVKLHRGHIMQKMRALSLVDLVRKTDRLAATPT